MKGMLLFFPFGKVFLKRKKKKHTTKVVLHRNRHTQRIKIQNLIALIYMILLGFLGKDIGCSTNTVVGKKLIH